MRAIRMGVLAAALVTFTAAPARADIIDFGVNILPTGSTTQVANGFWGDNSGYLLQNHCVLVLCAQRNYEFSINTSALQGAVESAHLSFDVNGQSLVELFAVFAFSGTYQYVGLLGGEPLALSMSSFADEIENGLLTLQVRTVTAFHESVRLDGANLRVVSNSVPEPSTLLLMGLGIAAAGAAQRRRRRNLETA